MLKVEEHCKKKKHPVQSTITPEHHLKVLRETGVDLDGNIYFLVNVHTGHPSFAHTVNS